MAVAELQDVLDRRNEARRYMQINYWDEWEDVYRSSKCLTKKILVTAKDGTQIEDTCNTTASAVVADENINAVVAGTSFSFGLTQPVTNPDCFSYFIVN